jgi:hypothetical protein
MDWYFRVPLRYKFLRVRANDEPPVKITLYRLFNTLCALGYLLARVIKRKDPDFRLTLDLIAGGLGIWSVHFLVSSFTDFPYVPRLSSIVQRGWGMQRRTRQ